MAATVHTIKVKRSDLLTRALAPLFDADLATTNPNVQFQRWQVGWDITEQSFITFKGRRA